MTTINVKGTTLDHEQVSLLTSILKEGIQTVTRILKSDLTVLRTKTYQEYRGCMELLLGLICVESDMSDLAVTTMAALEKAIIFKLARRADVDSWIYWHEPEHEEIWKIWVAFNPDVRVMYDVFYPQVKEVA